MDHRLFIYRVLPKSFHTVVILPHCLRSPLLLGKLGDSLHPACAKSRHSTRLQTAFRMWTDRLLYADLDYA